MPSTVLSKGALIQIGASNPSPRAIVFQYNPASLQHNLRADALPGADANPTQRTTALAKIDEVIRFTLVADAADSMQTATPGSAEKFTGLHPLLAALELLLRESADPPANSATLFVWGINRQLPVRLIGLEVQEELFDPGLNPLHATVQVTLQALDGSESGTSALVAKLFADHQGVLTALAESIYTATPSAGWRGPGLPA